MSHLISTLKRSTLPVLVVICLAALTASFAYAEGSLRPLATVIIGDPNAAVTGKLAVGTAVPGSKSLTVAGVIDFVGSGTVHNFFTAGPLGNMQIRSNVDEANTVYDATKSQWNMMMGAQLDVLSIRRSPAGATYNEDALFFINGSSGRVGIGTFDTGNTPTIPYSPWGRLDVETSTDNYAMYSSQNAVSGGTYGIVGLSSSPDGVGTFGGDYANSGNTKGVWGHVYSTTGTGVYGTGAATTGANYGVFGSTASPSGVGVYGYWPGSGSGWAGYFSGDLGVSNYLGVDGNAYFAGSVWVDGPLTKSGGGFRIDHPLDSSKYLSHSFVESPDMKNIYDGVVALDENGQAWVELPDWFEALNQDFRYQLTPIGGSMPDLYAAQGIQDNRFQIAGGVAGMEVSWQVTGIRHDTWAEENRIPVEEDKSESGMSGPSSKVDPQPPEGSVAEPPKRSP